MSLRLVAGGNTVVAAVVGKPLRRRGLGAMFAGPPAKLGQRAQNRPFLRQMERHSHLAASADC
jgi:hypothetical protein